MQCNKSVLKKRCYQLITGTFFLYISDHLMILMTEKCSFRRVKATSDHRTRHVRFRHFRLTSFAPFLPLTEQMERQSLAARGMSEMYISYVSHSFHL